MSVLSRATSPSEVKVAFLCLGTMGYPMAGHLARAGYRMRVYNRNHARALQWVNEFGGSAVERVCDAVSGVNYVLICTGTDRDLRDLFEDADGLLAGISPGVVVIDHTTASPAIARELAARLAEVSAYFLDAPVSGGQAGAENGQLSVMLGGEKNVFQHAERLIWHYAKNITWMGPVGNGQLTKLVNQVCIAGLLQGLSEGLHLAQKAGLDPESVYTAIAHGAAQSWQMDNRWQSMDEGRFDFGFAVDWMRKDLGMALDVAADCGASLQFTQAVDQLYAKLQALGKGRQDTSSLITLLGQEDQSN